MRLGKLSRNPPSPAPNAHLTPGDGVRKQARLCRELRPCCQPQSLAHPTRSSKLVQEASPAPGRPHQAPGPPLSSVGGWGAAWAEWLRSESRAESEGYLHSLLLDSDGQFSLKGDAGCVPHGCHMGPQPMPSWALPK